VKTLLRVCKNTEHTVISDSNIAASCYAKLMFPYLCGKVEEIVGLVGEEELQCTSSQVVPPQVYFSQS
jgi:hypothetical protein